MVAAAKRRSTGVLEIVWHGHITVEHVRELQRDVRAMAAVQPVKQLIADTRAVTGFDVGARCAGAELVSELRAGGLDHMVAVSASTLVRITGSTIALVAGVPLEFADSVEAAERLLLRRAEVVERKPTTARRTQNSPS